MLALGILAADDRHVHADLNRHGLAVDADDRLRVHVPAEAAGRELFDLREHLLPVDRDLERLGLLEEVRERDGAGSLRGHGGRFSPNGARLDLDLDLNMNLNPTVDLDLNGSRWTSWTSRSR